MVTLREKKMPWGLQRFLIPAYKIRLSAATRNIIEAFGSFRAFDSDEVFVKGNGRMKSYILVGEDGKEGSFLLSCERRMIGWGKSTVK